MPNMLYFILDNKRNNVDDETKYNVTYDLLLAIYTIVNLGR